MTNHWILSATKCHRQREGEKNEPIENFGLSRRFGCIVDCQLTTTITITRATTHPRRLRDARRETQDGQDASNFKHLTQRSLHTFPRPRPFLPLSPPSSSTIPVRLSALSHRRWPVNAPRRTNSGASYPRLSNFIVTLHVRKAAGRCGPYARFTSNLASAINQPEGILPTKAHASTEIRFWHGVADYLLK